METLEPPGSAAPDPELKFLLVRDFNGDWPRWKKAAIGSAVFHVAAITALFLIKGGAYDAPPPENLHVPYVVHLYVPKELTQKAPNKGPVAKLFMAQPVAPSPKVTEPAPKAARGAPPAPAPKPQIPPPAPAPPPAEEAHIQPSVAAPPPVALPQPDAPKMIVADSLQVQPSPPKPSGNISAPANSVQEAMKSLGNGGTASSGNRVGDSSDLGAGAGLNLPSSAPRPQSSLQLKSDPMGVDFNPYLLQVLQAVRTNWYAVYPEAARLGMRGRVTIEFAVTKSGVVAKVVYAGQSGAKALDQAAVAAISASNPLPPLPKEFRGDNIVLQMSFMYNMPR